MAKEFKKKVDIDFGDALKAIEALTSALTDLNDNLKDTEKEAEKAADAIDDVGDAADDAGKKSEKGTSGMSKGFKGVGTSIKGVLSALGLIGVALAVLDKFVDALQKNQKAADALSTAVNFIEIALTKIVDSSIDPLVAGFEKIFNDPQQAVKDFGNLIKENIQNRLEGFLELIPKLGEAINLLFKGEFAEAGKVAADASAKALLGVENFTDKVVEGTNAIAEFATETLDAAQAQTELDRS